jgi:hypothetical protein
MTTIKSMRDNPTNQPTAIIIMILCLGSFQQQNCQGKQSSHGNVISYTTVSNEEERVRNERKKQVEFVYF